MSWFNGSYLKLSIFFKQHNNNKNVSYSILIYLTRDENGSFM